MIRNAPSLATSSTRTRRRPEPPALTHDRPAPAGRRTLHPRSASWVWIEPDADAPGDWFDRPQVPALVLDQVVEARLVRVRTDQLRDHWVARDRVGVPCHPDQFRPETWAAMRSAANRAAAAINQARSSSSAAARTAPANQEAHA